MKPSQPYHSVTSLHRRLGGLLLLDFLVERLALHAPGGDPSALSLCVSKDDSGSFALPVSVMGFSVTSLFDSEKSAQSVCSLAEELGVTPNCRTSSFFDEPPDAYHSVLLRLDQVSRSEADRFLRHARIVVRKNGNCFLILRRGKAFPSYSSATTWIRSKRWRIRRSVSGSFLSFASRFFKGHARKDRFHWLDRIDSFLLNTFPFFNGDWWLFELQPASSQPLVVQLTPTLSLGGAERLTVQLARDLPEYGYETWVTAIVRGGPLVHFSEDGPRSFEIFNRTEHGRWKGFWQLYRFFRDSRPDVVHTHLFGAHVWGRIAAWLAKIPVIISTIHNTHTDRGFFEALLMRFLAPFSRFHIAISDAVASVIHHRYGVPAKRIRVIRNGVDLDRIPRRSPRSFHDIPRLLFVGRLEPQKNPERLLRALKDLPVPWKLTVIGDGSIAPHLRRLADRWNLSSRIHWEGFQLDVLDRYADYDVFCFPSQWEGYGLAAVEAAAAGLPLVVSDLPVLRELFNEEDVWFVDSDDEAEMSETISYILAHPEEAIRRAKKLSNQDWTAFALKTMVQSYGDLYKEVLCIGKPPSPTASVGHWRRSPRESGGKGVVV